MAGQIIKVFHENYPFSLERNLLFKSRPRELAKIVKLHLLEIIYPFYRAKVNDLLPHFSDLDKSY